MSADDQPKSSPHSDSKSLFSVTPPAQPPKPTSQRIASPTAIGPGSVIGQIEITKLIGKGGMGKVYCGHHRGLDTDVALKVMSEDFLSSQELLDRFVREARSAAKLDHSNIVRVHTIARQGSIVYIVLEYLPGHDAAQEIRLHSPRMPLSRALSIALCAARGIEHAHARGLIHRDIKPQNILIAEDGRIKVADFGLARLEASTGMTTSGTVLGTPDYISPEAGQGQETSYPTDVYSLGVTLYHLISGQVPFRGDTPVSLVYQHVHQPVPLEGPEWREVPQALRALLTEMCAKEPGQRPRMDDVVRRLAACLHAVDPENPLLGASGVSQATSARVVERAHIQKKILIATSVAVILAVAALLSLSLFGGGKDANTADTGISTSEGKVAGQGNPVKDTPAHVSDTDTETSDADTDAADIPAQVVASAKTPPPQVIEEWLRRASEALAKMNETRRAERAITHCLDDAESDREAHMRFEALSAAPVIASLPEASRPKLEQLEQRIASHGDKEATGQARKIEKASDAIEASATASEFAGQWPKSADRLYQLVIQRAAELHDEAKKALATVPPSRAAKRDARKALNAELMLLNVALSRERTDRKLKRARRECMTLLRSIKDE